MTIRITKQNQTTISVTRDTKEELRLYWNEEEHHNWDDFMRDVIKLIEKSQETSEQ